MADTALPLPKALLWQCLNWFFLRFDQDVAQLVRQQIGTLRLPGDVQFVLEFAQSQIRDLNNLKDATLDAGGVFRGFGSDKHRSLMRAVFLRYRRDLAAVAEEKREKTFHAELTAIVDEDRKTLESIVNSDWFRKINDFRIPRASDFVAVKFIPACRASLPAPQAYDEKFSILQSPSQFLTDLQGLRTACDARERPVSVAFLDIDDFKRLNEKYSNELVDRNVLPLFMQTIEGHVHNHGVAYRQGGDEYLLLLPGLSPEITVEFLDELRTDLAALSYPGIEEKTTVSVGLCVAPPDSPLTDREIRERANQAAKHAKEEGKNCIAAFRGDFSRSEFEVLRPKKSI